MKTKDSGPATPGLAHQRQAKAVEIVRDVLGGTLRMREKAAVYLPQFPKEHDDVYRMRRDTAVLFAATKRTIEAFSGMVFRKPLVLSKDLNPKIRDHFEDIDLAGRDLETFAQEHFDDAQADGHALIVVDMQPALKDAESLADEKAAGLRPYWTTIRKQDVVGFATKKMSGRRILTGLRIHEKATEREGYHEREVHRIRELTVGPSQADSSKQVVRYQIWQLAGDKTYPGEAADWTVVPDSQGEMSRSTMPVAVTYTNRTRFMESDPPFLDLALENIRHFQTDADNQNLARTAKVQTFTVIGESQENVKGIAIGSGFALVIPNKDAKVDWTSADGSNFEVFLHDLERQERRMAVMGLSMLFQESRGQETATSKRIDKSESDSFLARGAKALQNSLNQAMKFHAEWMDLDEAGGEIAVNMDFVKEPMDPALLRELREFWASRGISLETLLATMKRGEVFDDTFDVDEELERIASEEADLLDRASERIFGSGGGGDEDEDDDTGSVAA